ncbi:MAG TPA: sigma 54-interacting transcriptional regulator [Burkholderiales bacterium]|jgi:transcriptional regulator with PAS, ATPase and Fis domain|nr:sigma 54-interacting transcriptional regulator [Burkholderiales bacterium]
MSESARAKLPLDGEAILKLAARSMFQLFSNVAQGMMLVDRTGRVVWINEAYKKFLPALGFERAEDFVGRSVEEVVPNTLMRQVIDSGKPILVDLLSNKAGTFVVSRIPLRDESGEVIGALGMVLFDHPETTLQPLIAKFATLQRDLDDARRALAQQRRAKYTLASFIGSSPAVLEVKRQARRAAQSGATVLLLGETGTGKELLAHAIHAGSVRAERPFISVNLAAVPETLLESEFFGVAPGAYTGADRKGRDGKFRLADGGTLFLDEIGDMPLGLQAKLLRALQEQEFEPLGSNKVVKVDVRVIAATSRDLRRLVAEGQFREDLFYRLNVLPIRLPALRERLGDLEALAETLLESIAMRTGMPQRELEPSALTALASHQWPGNVRELRNVLEQAAMLTDNLRLGELDFTAILPAPAAAAPRGEPARSLRPLPQLIAEIERNSIESALAATGGNKASAAKLLGISRATLYERLSALKLS